MTGTDPVRCGAPFTSLGGRNFVCVDVPHPTRDGHRFARKPGDPEPPGAEPAVPAAVADAVRSLRQDMEQGVEDLGVSRLSAVLGWVEAQSRASRG